jgi:hypothetical protein
MRYRLRTLLIVMTLANVGVVLAQVLSPVAGGTTRRAKVRERPTLKASLPKGALSDISHAGFVTLPPVRGVPLDHPNAYP